MDTYILDLQRMSTEDGPGIRTTVFFKGCNLKCKWCHNPESIAFYRQKYWIKDKCMGCFSCEKGCPNKAISFDGEGMKVDEKLCNFCLACVDNCPMNAIEVKGEKYDIKKLVHELKKDIAYFSNSGGGVTLSGGEAMLQQDYILELLKELKDLGIHTALDTAGNYPFYMLEKVLPYIDLILYDLKHFDNAKHKELTGVENTLIKQNAARLGRLSYPRIWIRTPIIPNSTDSEENIAKIGIFIKENMPNIDRWELVSFNNLSKEKYRLLGKKWIYENDSLIEKAKMEKLCKIAREYVKKAIWSGATKLEV